MSRLPLLVYRNATPEVMAWSADVRERTRRIAAERHEWCTKLWDTVGMDAEERKVWVRGIGNAFVGISWPRSQDGKLPAGWFRPVKEDHLIRPRENKANRAVLAEMERLSTPDQRAEIEKFGMLGVTFAGLGLYSCSIRHEDDGVWVGWASKDIEDELERTNRHRPKPPADYGWVKVYLVEYLQRFGEDDA